MYMVNFTGCVTVYLEEFGIGMFPTHSAVNNGQKSIVLICSMNLESTNELTTWVTEGPKFLTIHTYFSHEKLQI